LFHNQLFLIMLVNGPVKGLFALIRLIKIKFVYLRVIKNKIMKVESRAHFEARVHIQRIRNSWRVLYPNMTEYQVMKRLLKCYQY
jgi:hypothetical protein